MGRLYDAVDDGLRDWLAAQPLFFVATAPTGPDGHVNLSPKGGAGTFRVLGPTTVAYLDLVGRGIEPAAHLRENGRIVPMFCASAGPPKVVGLHGRGRVVPSDAPAFAALLRAFAPGDEVRALARGVVVVEVGQIADSCGFVVPPMDYVGERDQLVRYGENRRARQGDGWMDAYTAAKNATSIDGLPGRDIEERADDARATARPGAGEAR